MDQWVIAEFHDGLQLVPKIWMSESEKLCKFPEYLNQIKINRAIAEMEEPLCSWGTHEVIQIFGRASSYESGVAKLKLAERISDIDLDIETIECKSHRRKRAKKVLSDYVDDDDDEDGDDDNAAAAEPQCSNLGPNTSPRSITPFKSHDKRKRSPIKTTPERDFQAECLRKLDVIYNMVKKMEKDIEKLKVTWQNTSDNSMDNWDDVEIFPLKTDSDLKTFEFNSDKDPNFLKKHVRLLKRLGGTSLQQIIIIVLRRMMTDELAEQYSLLGARSKKPLKPLNIYRLIVDVTRYHHEEVTESQIGEIVARWLAQAKSRKERKEKRELEKQSESCEFEDFI